MFDLVIGNIPGTRNPNVPVPDVETCAAAVTSPKAQKNAIIKPLVAKDVTAQTSVTKDKLAKLQQEDNILEKYVNLKDAVGKVDTK